MNTEANGKRGRHRWLRVMTAAVGVTAVALAMPACLDRPIEPQQPTTKAPSLQLYQSNKIDKIDLLFVIDNSISMADKQKVLAEAVPDLVKRLVQPNCLNEKGKETDNVVDTNGKCPDGHKPEFTPVADIHIGIVSSSLGSMGQLICDDPAKSSTIGLNDKGHLLARKADGTALTTWNNKGFLAWDPGHKKTPRGADDVDVMSAVFKDMVTGVGQTGCGYEMTLEAWRRFLVDPDPYEKANVNGLFSSGIGTDTELLNQRKDFLRSDSLVAIIMLSDENDCSLSYSRTPTQSFLYFDGTPEGLRQHLKDDTNDKDHANLRCFNQGGRYKEPLGDQLFPISRYVDSLTKTMVPVDYDSKEEVINPLFCSNPSDDRKSCKEPTRDPSLIFLAGIVGVPWQDIARDPKDLNKGYRTGSELGLTPAQYAERKLTAPNGLQPGQTLWDVILGPTNKDDHSIQGEPLDPFMIESVNKRTGKNPITGDDLEAARNEINRNEWDITDKGDLQYSCIFELPELPPCTNEAECDCADSKKVAGGNPLCNGEKVQARAKAYPGRRQLAVLKGVQDQAIVASVCPSQLIDDKAGRRDYGYRAAVRAIIDRLKGALQGECWKKRVTINKNAKPNEAPVACVVIEATKDDGSGCPPCQEKDGREDLNKTQTAAIESDSTFKARGLKCACVIKPVVGDALRSCVQDESPPPDVKGWCYVDPEQDPSHNAALVSGCPERERRMMRFAGKDIPKSNATTYLQCVGSTIAEQ